MTKGRSQIDGQQPADEGRDRADDLLGAVVPLRDRQTPQPSSPEADLSNVIPFLRRKRGAGAKSTPSLTFAAGDRPAPAMVSAERNRQIALLVLGSLILHGALFAAFNRDAEPHASIGMISVTAELVLGSETNAGQSQTASESEAASAPSVSPADKPLDQQEEAPRKQLDIRPVEDPKETKPETAQAAKAPQAIASLPTAEKDAELVVDSKQPEKPELTSRENKQEARKKPAPREAARHPHDDGESRRERSAPASAPANSSNSIGRGRSQADTNYRGIVAAHLARFKQFPADARRSGQQGAVTLIFSLSGSGSVNSVRLARGSGVASIDQEAQAMVRRASPFPAPPSERPMTFTVPVSFYLR